MKFIKKNIKYIVSVVLFLVCTNLTLLGQIEGLCGTSSTPPNTPINIAKVNSCDASCNGLKAYAPDEFFPHHRPIVEIRVNIHFIQQTNGTGNFTEIDDGHGNTNRNGIVIANEMITRTNELLASNQQTLHDQTQYGCDFALPGYVGEPTYLNTQFRLVLEPYPNDPNNLTGVYFHQSDLHYEDTNWQSRSVSQLETNFANNKPEAMHLFFQAQNVANSNNFNWDGIAEGIGDQTNPGTGINNNILIIDNIWDTYSQSTGELSSNWGKYGKLNHEVGHLLGLRHTFLKDDGTPRDPNEPCDDTVQNYACDCLRFNSSSGHCDEVRELDNNIMNYNNDQTAWTPCQLCIVHDYFSNRTPAYVINDYCTNHKPPVYVPEQNPATIGEVITWNSTRNMQGDVIVRSGNTLIISCTVRLPDNATVVVERGAKLILDGGSITNACEPDPANNITGMWGGIQVWGGNTQTHLSNNTGQLISPAELLGTGAGSYPQALTDHGVVVLTNSARLENAVTAISTKNQGGDATFHGGIVYAEDSEFLNNGRAIIRNLLFWG